MTIVSNSFSVYDTRRIRQTKTLAQKIKLAPRVVR